MLPSSLTVAFSVPTQFDPVELALQAVKLIANRVRGDFE